ncbi:MAG TPA: polysaccharide biosynthesis tyrosine autokinase [Sphingomicrobium sp.]|jgi:capsular exopolysaccharide synthesis family protein
MNLSRNNLVQSAHAQLPMRSVEAAMLHPEFVFANEAPESGFDLVKLWSVMWRNRLLILAVLAVSLALGVVSLFISSPVYQATASIEIENQPTKVLGTEDFQQSANPTDTDRLLQTQIDILRSRALAERVASDLNLSSNDRFLASQGVKPRPGLRHEQVIETLRDSLRVWLPRNTRVVPVSFDSSDPALAARIANRYVDALIEGNLQRHFDTSRYSKEFLQEQLELTKARLEHSEEALLAYARSVGIVDPSAGAGDPNSSTNNAPRSLTSANLIDLNQSLAGVKTARIQAEGRWRQALATPVMSLPEVLTNPAIQEMTQRRAELEASYQQDLQHRKADHPMVQQQAAAIRELDRQIGTLANSIRSSIKNQYQAAVKQEAQLSATVGHLKGATMAEQQLGIRYNILKREVTTNRELYDGLLQRYKEVSAEAGVTSNNISVVDRASSPLLPISPRPLVNIGLALLFGLALSFGVVVALETFRDGVRSPDEVEQRFGIPLLGHTPLLAAGSGATEQLMDPGSNVSEAYQAVRTSVELSSELGTPKTLLITSSRAGEGKSTTSLAMARDAARSGRKVLLIDADMRRPSLHTLLRTAKEPGLSSFLTQQLPAEHVIQETDTPGLSFMPAGPKPPSPAELVSGMGMGALLTYLSDKYDQIIIDSPPVLGLADVPRLASIVHATILVIEANRSHRRGIDNAIRRLNAARAHIIGAVLVKFDPAKADFGYDYAADYYSYGEASDGKATLIPAVGAAGGA